MTTTAAEPDALFENLGNVVSERHAAQKENEKENVEEVVVSVDGIGGSSGRSTTMIGTMEWSATGRSGVSLALLSSASAGVGGSFTFRAARRCASRLLEMGTVESVDAWRKKHQREGEGA